MRRTPESALAEGRKYTSRNEFSKANKGAYNYCWKNNLLDIIFPPVIKPVWDLLDNNIGAK